MRSASLVIIVTLTLVGGGLIGCHGGGTTPPATDQALNWVATPTPTPSAAGLLAGYSLTLRGADLGATLAPLRSGALGESFLVSGAEFFAGPLCRDCLTIESVRREGPAIAVTFAVRHPYAPGNVALPPSASNRLDLDVFDLALVWRSPGDATHDFPLTGRAMPASSLAAAAYSTELSNVLNDPTALPLYLVVDDEALSQNTSNRFAMGATGTVEAQVLLDPGAATAVELYLTMGYGASATRPTRLSPQYFNPEFNRKAAWKIAVLPPPATPGMTWRAGQVDPYPVEVQVWDWQVGATVDATLSSPERVAAASEVASVSLEIPGMTTTEHTVSVPAGGTGQPGDPLVYHAFVPNENLAEAGTYWGVVQVLDTRTPGSASSGGNPDTLVHADAALGLNWFDIPEYAAYQLFTATVLADVGVGELTVGKVTGSRKAMAGAPFIFHVEASTTEPGASLTYNWDNGETSPGIYDEGTAVDDGDMSLTFSAPGTYVVDVQVTDGFNTLTSPAPLSVEVFPAGVLVDGDNVGDPMENGTWAHPYDTIPEGISNMGAAGRVFVDAAATDYAAYTQVTNLALYGIDRLNTMTHPTVMWSGSHTVFSGDNMLTCGLTFDMSGGTPIQFFSATNVTFADCRFTGQVNSTFASIMQVFSGSDYTLRHCEVVDFKLTLAPAPAQTRLIRPFLFYTPTTNVTVTQCEFHDIGFTELPSPDFPNSDIMDILMCFGPDNTVITNNLFYDINLPQNPTKGGYGYMTITNAHSQDSPFTWAYNTVHDIDIQVGGPTGVGTTEFIGFNMFTNPGVLPDLRNNIIELTLQGITDNERLTGFSGNCCEPGPYPVTYNTVYFGTLGLGCTGMAPCYWRAYAGTFTKGTGAYDQQDGIDAMFDLTPGPNFYHPLNPLVSAGGEGGTAMGCFGGPEGDWVPLSQLD